MRTSPSGIAMILLLAEAGGAQAQASGPDPCALLTREEMAALSNDHPTKPRPRVHGTPGQGMSSLTCTYHTRTDKLGAAVTVERGRTAEELAQYLKLLLGTAKSTSGSAMQPVAGLGDQAHWGQIGETNGMLHVIKGTDVLMIRTYGKGPGAGTLAKTQEVMALVYPRFVKLIGD